MIIEVIKFIAVGSVLLGALLMILGSTIALFTVQPLLALIFGMMTGGGLIFVIATLLEDVFF